MFGSGVLWRAGHSVEPLLSQTEWSTGRSFQSVSQLTTSIVSAAFVSVCIGAPVCGCGCDLTRRGK